MKQMNKIIMFMLLISLVFVSGCSDNVDFQEEYNKCTAVCASVLEEDFVTMNLCVDECKERFLGEE